MSIQTVKANARYAALRRRRHQRDDSDALGAPEPRWTASRPFAWLMTILVAAFGGILRFVRLGSPRAVVFDETYYVKDAWTMLNTGEARDWPKLVTIDGVDVEIDRLFAAGDTDRWLNTAEYVVHPPVGKWMIAAGLKLFGGADNPVAWRASVAIAGVVAIVLITRVALRLFHNLPIALIAGLLMSLDGLGIVMSRTGLLDNFIMVFALGAFSLMLMHRDWARARLRRQYAIDAAARTARFKPGRRGLILQRRGPMIALSWYRVGAAFLLGMATGVKWSGTYLFAVFCVISVLWDAWERRRIGYRAWFTTGLVKDGLVAACYMVPIYALTYLGGWLNWFLHADSYMHDWAANHPGEGVTWLPESLRSFVAYHAQMWQFHTTLDAPHDYKANPLTWPLQVRPTSFYWEKLSGHPGLCSLAPDSQCVAAITSLGNPLIWWAGSLCTVTAIIIAIAGLMRGRIRGGTTREDGGYWRIWAVLAGFLGGWLPWAQYLNRTTFTFYSIVILPWIVLAICYVLDWLRTHAEIGTYRLTVGLGLMLIILVSAFFYPIWTTIPVPYEFWLSHMWFRSWI